MIRRRKPLTAPLVITGIFILCAQSAAAERQLSAETFQSVVSVLEKSLQQGEIIGAQVVVGVRDRLLLSKSLGTIAADSRRGVDCDTMFCIGSCSKPLASTCLLILAEEGTLELDTPIDQWLPSFKAPRLSSGSPATAAPTLRQLLAHRGGVYSQKEKITRDQSQAIYNFSRTLTESVELISKYELIAEPGGRFAYSGAGYCVVGRVAEVASGKQFDTILRQRICRPLGLRRTTYFPPPADNNVATAGLRRGEIVVVNRQAPWLLGDKLKMQLVGGSIYSTAQETAKFARLIAQGGRWEGKQIIPQRAFAEMTRRQYEGQGYSLGWQLKFSSGKLVEMSHGGSLAGYRSLVQIDMRSGFYLVVHRTLTDSNDQQIAQSQSQALARAFRLAIASRRR